MLSAVALLALGTPYVHRILPRGDDTVVEVRKASGSLIWRRTFPGDIAVRWSKDRRAIAVFDQSFYLTTWIAGGRVRRHKIGPRGEGYGEPPSYKESLRWSPDKKRLLILCPGTQGDMILDTGWLLVIQVRNGRVQDVDGAMRGTPEWIGNRTVRYTGYSTRSFMDKEGVQQHEFEGLPNQIKQVR